MRPFPIAHYYVAESPHPLGEPVFAGGKAPAQIARALRKRATVAEKKRDLALAAYHHFEMSSASVQIAIVLASASIITTIPALFWTAGALGVVGVAFCVIGFWFPTAVHLF